MRAYSRWAAPHANPIRLTIVAGFLGAIMIGAFAASAPVLAAGIVAVAGGVFLLALGERLLHAFVALLSGLLLGYMYFGKGFAYVGVAPLYAGEAILAVGLIALLLTLPRLRLSPLHLGLLAFMMLGLLRTVPYIQTYGLDAVRDGVIWIYGLFALVLSAAVRRKDLELIVRWYGRLLPWFVAWVPIVFVITHAVGSSLPTYPGTDVTIPYFKGGDMGVHLAGIAGFLLLGLYSRQFLGKEPRPRELYVWPIWILGVVMAGAINRGGLIAAGSAIIMIMILRPSRRIFGFMAAGSLVFLLLLAFNVEVDLGTRRAISANQVVDNVRSIFVDTGDERLEGTKGWRLEWWGDIYDYTFNGPYFWTGKGFGVNLALDDGFDPEGEGTLRAPHNGHLSVLARMGVPGLALWIALQLGLAIMMLVKCIQWRRERDELWSKVIGWLLVYWAAFIINMSFDVYLEGPQGGIWFWSVIGLALAVFRLKGSADADAGPEPREPERLAPAAEPTG